MPAFSSCRLAHSWPLSHNQNRIRRVGVGLPKRATPLGVPEVEVEVVVFQHECGRYPIIDDPAAEHILAIRKRMKLSRRKFADRFGRTPGCEYADRTPYNLMQAPLSTSSFIQGFLREVRSGGYSERRRSRR